MMHKCQSCFGFVPDFSIGFIQTSAITRFNLNSCPSCTDHQLFFSSLLIACLTVLKSLGFFRFSELIFQFRFSRLNANTRVERRFECFGFVPEKIRTSLSKQILIKTLIARQSGDLWHANQPLAQMEAHLLGYATNLISKLKKQRIT